MTVKECNFFSKHQYEYDSINVWKAVQSITSTSTPEELEAICNNRLDSSDIIKTGGGGNGWHLLQTAASKGNVPVVKHILKKNPATVNMGNTFGWTPLFSSCAYHDQSSKKKRYEVVNTLLDHKADVNCATSSSCSSSDYGWTPFLSTPLWSAVQKARDATVATLFLARGALLGPNEIDEDAQEVLNTAKKQLENYREDLDDKLTNHATSSVPTYCKVMAAPIRKIVIDYVGEPPVVFEEEKFPE